MCLGDPFHPYVPKLFPPEGCPRALEASDHHWGLCGGPLGPSRAAGPTADPALPGAGVRGRLATGVLTSRSLCSSESGLDACGTLSHPNWVTLGAKPQPSPDQSPAWGQSCHGPWTSASMSPVPRCSLLPASPAFSLAAWARVSGWSVVFPNLLPGPLAHTPFCQGRAMSRGLRALLVLGESGSWAGQSVPRHPVPPADEVLCLHPAGSWGTGFRSPHSTWPKALGEQLGRSPFRGDPESSRICGHRHPRSAPELASARPPSPLLWASGLQNLWPQESGPHETWLRLQGVGHGGGQGKQGDSGTVDRV